MVISSEDALSRSHASERAAEEQSIRNRLIEMVRTHRARIGVIGLGYVGLPTALAFASKGFATIGFDINAEKVGAINAGRIPVGYDADEIAQYIAAERFQATSDFAQLRACDCITVSVPTPLSFSNEPDLSYIHAAVAEIQPYLRRGQLIVLESTTYPGGTDEIFLPKLLETGLRLDDDFLLAFSPERIDPGNSEFTFGQVPRIVGGSSEASRDVAAALYEQVVPFVHNVSSTRVAETSKLLENTFRAINIGLVNELAMMCYQMGIDVWEVIEAAKSKPFGFVPFYPGPGVGGHCIPLVPEFLSWKGRQFGVQSRFISLAEQINGSMPNFVVDLIADGLNADGKPLRGAHILLIGVSYKKDIGDALESPALEIVQLLRSKYADVAYHDPFVPALDFATAQLKLTRSSYYADRERRRLQTGESTDVEREARRLRDPLRSLELTDEVIRAADCVVIVTGHSSIDYARIAREATLIVDTRNALDEDLRRSSNARIVRL